MTSSEKNLFCEKSALGNEASVETFMLSRMLTALGYRDSQIRTKEQIDQLVVSAGRRHAPYRPDYVMTYKRKPRWVLDAKSTTENIDDWIGQCQSYCVLMNSRQEENPVRYFMLSNGLRTSVFKWDNETPVLELAFEDFVEGSPKWEELCRLLAPRSVAQVASQHTQDEESEEMLTLRHVSPGAVNKAFASAHEYIYKHEQLSYGAAFMEFVKLVFLKMNSDKAAHGNPSAAMNDRGDLVIPAKDVQFTVSWIESTERQHVSNPVNTVMFKNLVDDLEEQITKNKKKRIFDKGENIRLKAGTIKEIVKRFEDIDLYTIDEDLNGRMFETFLNATLRGKSLGQYFTPRSVVKMATGLVDLQVSGDDEGYTDHVLDGCCGTGGYLISALATMWQKVEANGSLSRQEKAARKLYIAEHNIWGVDAARDPKLARIARMNMFLHGDGGSRIYQLDTLDKNVTKNKETDDLELQAEKDEFKDVVTKGDFFDIVLTNPPFATEYKSSEESDKRILKEYDIAHFVNERGRSELRSSMRSSVLFMERYYDLLKGGGTLVTVIDDGVLGGDDYSFVRDWLRSHFLIRAVISLPGDAFQRSQARVKTSLLVMEKRHNDVVQEQPPVFMWYCSHVGLDDPNRERVLPGDAQLAENARNEISEVVNAYKRFRMGDPDVARTNSVLASAIQGRMDVKAVLPRPGRNQSKWEQLGLSVRTLGQLAVNVFDDEDVSEYRSQDVISTRSAPVNDQVCLARVRYDGIVEKGDAIFTVDSSSTTLYRLHEHDLVLSNINAVNGAIGIVPKELDGLVVTSEYTVLRPAPGMDESALWTLLRSPVARADMILLSTGIGRTRIAWQQIKELKLPVIDGEQVGKLSQIINELFDADRRKRELLGKLQGFITDSVPMSDNEANQILAAFKPPR